MAHKEKRVNARIYFYPEEREHNWHQAIQKVDQSLANSQTAIDRTIREER